MALVTLPGFTGVIVLPYPLAQNPSVTNATMDAAGESLTAIGIVALSTGPGTSKVLSAAGSGKVYWSPSTNTFANAGTNLRIGVQDVVTGVEDGTFDVYADLVGGTDTITAGTVVAVTMESGTKTIAHGDTIAISVEMTARGGADSVLARYISGSPDFPNSYVTIDSGSGPAKAVGTGAFAIAFDDGTIGWILGAVPAEITVPAPTTGTTPDEYATIFQVPFKTEIWGIAACLDNVASGDTFEAILYSNPLGVTPVAERTVTVDTDLVFSATHDGAWRWLFTSAFTPDIDTDYAVAIRPTSANAITIYNLAFGTNNAALRATTPLGTNWRQGTRSDNAGAFTESTINLSCIGPILGAFDDGAGSGTTTQFIFVPE